MDEPLGNLRNNLFKAEWLLLKYCRETKFYSLKILLNFGTKYRTNGFRDIFVARSLLA